MKQFEVYDRTPLLIEQLLAVWEDSVRATHDFLSEAQRNEIKKYVPDALRGVEHLIIAEKEPDKPVAFMGVQQNRLEMLFLSSKARGMGLGRQLLEFGIKHYGIREVTVNEQNPQAVGFYQHMGFEIYRRTDCDEQGNPYPLLYLKWSGKIV